jgi:hypothetical protein
MNARQCKRCRKLFQYTGNPICLNCIKELDLKFNMVRDYIYDNPGAHIDQVCEATEVESSQVHRWLAEGRLLLSQGSPITLTCEKCGAPILSGKQCDACLNKLRNTLQGAADAMKPPPPKETKKTERQREKMHVEIRKK